MYVCIHLHLDKFSYCGYSGMTYIERQDHPNLNIIHVYTCIYIYTYLYICVRILHMYIRTYSSTYMYIYIFHILVWHMLLQTTGPFASRDSSQPQALLKLIEYVLFRIPCTVEHTTIWIPRLSKTQNTTLIEYVLSFMNMHGLKCLRTLIECLLLRMYGSASKWIESMHRSKRFFGSLSAVRYVCARECVSVCVCVCVCVKREKESVCVCLRER